MSTIVVSAADATYAGLLFDLVDSLCAAAIPDLRIGCLDLGLTDAARARLRPLVHEIIRPEWPFRPHPVFGTGPRHLSRAVRPFLPEYFPGHETYIWLDADCWVQDRMALQGLAHAASTGALAVVPAADRSYIHSDEARGWVDRRYRMALGDDAADRLRPFNYINCGVLALRAKAPHWVAWERRFQAALDRWEGDFLSDQAVLNALVYLDAVDHAACRIQLDLPSAAAALAGGQTAVRQSQLSVDADRHHAQYAQQQGSGRGRAIDRWHPRQHGPELWRVQGPGPGGDAAREPGLTFLDFLVYRCHVAAKKPLPDFIHSLAPDSETGDLHRLHVPVCFFARRRARELKFL
jgi:hypothetical protein